MSPAVPDGPAVGPALARLANLRDVAASAPALRPGALWRSAQPLAGDAVPAEVAGWPPRTVVDLRSAAELPGPHPLLAAGTAVRAVELLDIPVDPSALAQRRPTMLELYLSMLEPGTGLVRAVAVVADEPGPALVHCAAGKDRTGLVVALVLRLLGVPPEAVLADFSLTTAAMPAVVARIASSTPLPPGADVASIPREYLEAPLDALGAVLQRWDDHPGGAAGWAAARGGGDDLVARLRSRLLLEP